MTFKYDNITKPLNNVMRMRNVDPITHTVLVLFVLLVTIAVSIFLGLIEGIRLFMMDEKVKTELPKARQAKADEVNKANAIYYVIRKIEMKKHSLVQNVNFYIQTKDGMKDITGYICNQYYYVQRYCGRADGLKGTAKLTDYDIIRLSEDLNGRLKETLL